MSEYFPTHESLDDLETLLLSAKDFVRPTGDLRPRLLEAARSQRKDRQVLRHVRRAAIVLVVLGALASGLRQGGELPTQREPASVIALPATVAIDADWSLVDAYTELRRRQAELICLPPELPRPRA